MADMSKAEVKVFYHPGLIRLNITTWVGTVACGTHWYGSLRTSGEESDRPRIDVQKPLTQKEARTMNKEEELRGLDFQYRKGQLTSRFFSREMLLKWAKKTWKKEFSKGVVLIRGDSCSCEPMECLDAPEEAQIEALNAIYQRCIDNGWWDNEEKMEALEQEWAEMILPILENG